MLGKYHLVVPRLFDVEKEQCLFDESWRFTFLLRKDPRMLFLCKATSAQTHGENGSLVCVASVTHASDQRTGSIQGTVSLLILSFATCQKY